MPKQPKRKKVTLELSQLTLRILGFWKNDRGVGRFRVLDAAIAAFGELPLEQQIEWLEKTAGPGRPRP